MKAFKNPISGKTYPEEIDLVRDLATYLQAGFDRFNRADAIKRKWPFKDSEIDSIKQAMNGLSLGGFYSLLQLVEDKPSYDYCIEYEFCMIFNIRKSRIIKLMIFKLYKLGFPGSI